MILINNDKNNKNDSKDKDKDKDNDESMDRLLQEDIIDLAHELVEFLEQGDINSARQVIINLNQIREDSLYKELGKLTRDLHESLKEIDIGITDKEIPTARSRLSYVIKLTEDAANKTMDGIESTIPISDTLAKDAKALLEEWSRFRRRELTLQQFKDLYKEMMVFLENVESTAVTIHGNLQEILVAQNYQDLTGQAIKKVMHTVSSLENRLVELIKIAAKADDSLDFSNLLGTSEESSDEGSGDKGKEGQQVVTNQDEVDDLLSSLGF